MPAQHPLPVRSEADIQRLEETPLHEAVPFCSTYALIRESAIRHANRPALSFLPSARLDETPVRWTYEELLAGIHQTANLLHQLGWATTDVLAVMLPAGLAYHLALWGGGRLRASCSH